MNETKKKKQVGQFLILMASFVLLFTFFVCVLFSIISDDTQRQKKEDENLEISFVSLFFLELCSVDGDKNKRIATSKKSSKDGKMVLLRLRRVAGKHDGGGGGYSSGKMITQIAVN